MEPQVVQERDFIDKRPLVSLFTRPSGFGKSLNMDMLQRVLWIYSRGSENNARLLWSLEKIWGIL